MKEIGCDIKFYPKFLKEISAMMDRFSHPDDTFEDTHIALLIKFLRALTTGMFQENPYYVPISTCIDHLAASLVNAYTSNPEFLKQSNVIDRIEPIFAPEELGIH